MVEMNGKSCGADSPFGDYKQAGNGREGGIRGLEDFLEIKAVSDRMTESVEMDIVNTAPVRCNQAPSPHDPRVRRPQTPVGRHVWTELHHLIMDAVLYRTSRTVSPRTQDKQGRQCRTVRDQT